MIKSKIQNKSRINAWAVASPTLNLNPPLDLTSLPTAAESRTVIWDKQIRNLFFERSLASSSAPNLKEEKKNNKKK